MNYQYFTSESVASGHPDKICDRISDAILDALLAGDPKSRVGVEVLATHNKLIIAGEVTSRTSVDFAKVARQVIKYLGYTRSEYHFSYRSPIEVLIHQQSPDIALGVDQDGAGDQGMMFGYACTETPEYMPLPITLAHRLVSQLDSLRTSKKLPYLRPDGKSEVTIKYQSGKPVAVDRIVIASPTDPNITLTTLKADLYHHLISPLLNELNFKLSPQKLIVNGTGKWNIGGPSTDTGLTGRKIIVDTYGGMARTGGGCFSGKDPSKVDRSGAYAARYLAKNIVAHGLATRVEIQLAYVIGLPRPITTVVETFGTAKVPLKVIQDFALHKLLDLSVKGIIDGLNLRRPIYQPTASYGHFGKENLPWEKIIKF